MRNSGLIFCLCLIFLLLLSCEPDLTDKAELAFDSACADSINCTSGNNSCTTIDGNMWSPRSLSQMTWEEARSYCYDRKDCGYSDWHLPTISELRTLIQNCPDNETGGTCAIYDPDSLGATNYCGSCGYNDSGGKYSKLGDAVELWSSSSATDSLSDRAFYVNFGNGIVDHQYTSWYLFVRCVK